MLINNLSVQTHKIAYHENAITRIDNLFNDKIAEALLKHTGSAVPFKNAFIHKGEVKTLSNDDFRRMSQSELQEIQSTINAGAAKGFGFLYGTFRINENTDRKEHPLLAELYQALNSDQLLSQIREITGDDTINSANAQVTRYTPGQFLTRHNDVNDKEQRRVAYVISLTPVWHPDWGGLLQFYSQDGSPTYSYSPVFNSMMLFDVKHPHSVTYLTPFAQQPRLSVTGWFKEN